MKERPQSMLSYLIYLWQVRDLRPVQYPQRQADHLQILAASRGGDVSGFGADIVDDRLLQPGDQEMCALIHDGLLDS